MRKKIGTLLIIGSLGALCAGLAACSNDSAVDKYFKDGNVISVTYDASGGSIAGGTNVKLMDMFNPDKFEADASGLIKIKLRNPTDPARPKPGVGNIKVENGENSLVGWYQNRESDGNGGYTYSDPWDFETNYLEYDTSKKGEKLEFTLYAAWIPRYTFEYYYKTKADGDWEKYATTGFNYLTAKEEDKIVYVPDWNESTGKMEYTHNSVTFPSVNGKTFKAAYSDESCTAAKTSFDHPGTLDKDTAKAENTVQKIYVEFYEGNHYRISTAEQFVNIRDINGHYTFLSSELDFTGKTWPNIFLTSEFNGTIKSESAENPLVFKNVNVQYNVSSNAALGGLFGKLGEKAEIANLTFENATFVYKKAVNRLGGNFGFFTGLIDDKATVENVKISGELQLWEMRVTGGLNFNLTANGDKRSGVSNEGIQIKICGNKVLYDPDYAGKYEFKIDPENATVDGDGNISITPLEDSNEDEKVALRMKDYEYKEIVYGGKENE